MSLSDEELIRSSQRGDRAAFEEMVRRTARGVFARIYLETGDADRTEDLVQETYLSAWKRIRQVTDASGFRGWLFSVAHSVVIDAQRREKRKKRSGARGAPALLDEVEARGDGPAQRVEIEETKQQVLSVMRSLPQEYRDVLMLRYIGGADYESIGKQLGISNGSLRGLLARGMEMMRRGMSNSKDR